MSGHLSRYTLKSFIDRTIGEEHIVQFREDLKRPIFEHNTKFNQWEEKNMVLKQQAHDGLQEARSTRWNKYAFWLGVVGVILGVFGPIGTLPSVASLFLSFVGGLHKVTVDILAFDQPHREYRNRRLKFMSAWNRGVMTSWKAMLILPLGIFVRYTPDRYRLALWVLDDMMEDKYS